MSTKGPRVYIDRTLVLLKPESERGVDPLPTAQENAFLCGNVEVSVDPQLLERDVNRPSFSPWANEVGRKIMRLSFTHEIKGAGNLTSRPKLGALLSACHMREVLVTAGAASQIETPAVVGPIIGPSVVWDKTAPPTQRYGSYLVRVVEGGASGAAKLQVFRWNQSDYDISVLLNTRHQATTNFYSLTKFTLDDSDETSLVFTVDTTGVAAGDTLYAVIGGVVFKHVVTAVEAAAADPADTIATNFAAVIDAHPLLAAAALDGDITVTFEAGAAPVTVTTGSTAVPLGSSGATITPNWLGNLVKGQMWVVQLYEQGYTYLPSSDDSDMETTTLYAYIGGQLYRMTAAIGTVTFTGTAGEYGSAQFEFIGNYVEPTQEPLPRNPVYELSRPPKVELAQMSIRGDKDFCAESFTITYGNEINERLCINAADGYSGSEISDRTPTMTVNPEGSLEVYTNMWGDFSKGEEVPVHLRVGSVLGNMVRFYADNATYTGIAISDRNNTQVMEPTFQLNGLSAYGDDELRIVFPIA
jgi:hypothetical protein